MALRFKIKHLFILLTIAATICCIFVQRQVSASKFGSLESALASQINDAKESFRYANPKSYEIVKDLDLKVLGPGGSLEIDFSGSVRRYQYEIADSSLEVYLYADLELGFMSSSISTVIEYADEFPDDPYPDIAKYVEFILREKLGIIDVTLSRMDP